MVSVGAELKIKLLMRSPGHQLAWERAGVLHNDVSVGNIMLDAEAPPNRPRGFLTDWDSCKYEEDLAQSGSSYAEPRSVSASQGAFVYVLLICVRKGNFSVHGCFGTAISKKAYRASG